MKKYLIIIPFILACHTNPPPPVVVNPGDSDLCPEACDKLRSMGCEEGETLADGTTCEEFCIYSQEMGHALQPLCIIKIVDECSDMFDLESTCINFNGT